MYSLSIHPAIFLFYLCRRAPFTAALLFAELTQNYDLIPSLLAATYCATEGAVRVRRWQQNSRQPVVKTVKLA